MEGGGWRWRRNGTERRESTATTTGWMRTRVDHATRDATGDGDVRAAAREARFAHRGEAGRTLRCREDGDDDDVVSAFAAKEAMDAHAERIRGALTRARGYDRGRRGGGVEWDPLHRPTCVMVDVKSALRGLVPGEMFFAPRLAVEGFTTRAGSRETRTGQLVAYARSIDRGYGLEGWDGTEDPATAFRDGAADVVDGRGEPDRVDTGLVVFTGDASHCSVAQDLDDDVVGLPGAYKRGRAATFGGVGTLCQWMFRNQNGNPTRRANAEDDAFMRTCGADDPDVVEFRAISLVWCGFPADFDFQESTNRIVRRYGDVSLIPSVWLDTDVCSGFDVYSLGLEVISESRIRDARKLMMCSLLVRASQSSEISARFGRCRDAAAVRDAYRLVTQIFLVRHVDTRLTRARVVRFASNLSLSSARVDRRSIDRSMISLRARDARSLDERMRGYT